MLSLDLTNVKLTNTADCFIVINFLGGSTEEEKIRVDIAENQVCFKAISVC